MSTNRYRDTLGMMVLVAVVLMLAISPALAQLPTQVPLNPKNVPQFVDPLPHFAGVRVDAKQQGANLTISIEDKVNGNPIAQQALSTGTLLGNGTLVGPANGLTSVWGYKIVKGATSVGPFWPAFTLETHVGDSVVVKYVNNIGGHYQDVGLIVDQTIHWADPLNAMGSMDPYTGDVPAVVHLHGGEVPSAYDGGPDSWFTKNKAATGPGFVTDEYHYPNQQEATTLWFHDHTLGATRLNVYAGLAGFYFLRGADEENVHLPGWSGDNLVTETGRFGAPAFPTQYLPEIEVVIQDRMFDNTGQLYFPSSTLATNPLIHPFWVPEFLGDIITVNGKTWPFLNVEPRRYRFRLLNGSNARTYELFLVNLATKAMGPAIYQVGTDGGLLDVPAKFDPALGQRLVIAPGERADVIIDFNGYANSALTVRNTARAPYPGGAPPKGSTTGRVMQFVVGPAVTGGPDNSYDPALGQPLRPALHKLANFATGTPNTGVVVNKYRQLTLNEVMGAGGPVEILVNNTKWDGTLSPNAGGGFRSEVPTEGETEVWQVINLTADAHPIHLHLVQFQILSRQAFNTNKYTKAYNALFPAVTGWYDPMTNGPINYPGGVFVPGYGPPMTYGSTFNPATGMYFGGNPDVTPYLQGQPAPANPNEQGWKDTFLMFPGEVTTVIARFAGQGAASVGFPFDPSQGPGYVWHCHIIDHEDNEMMRPMAVVANPALTRTFGSPGIMNYPMTMAEKNTDGKPALLKEETGLPNDFALSQNYPNPFNPTTEIGFTLPEQSHVVLKVFNALGQEVQTLIDAEAPAGRHVVKLDASALTSGVYFYTIQAGSFSAAKKMVLMK